MCSTKDILQLKFGHRKLTLKVRILHILTIFTQVILRLKNFVDWLLVLGLMEGLVECATMSVKIGSY